MTSTHNIVLGTIRTLLLCLVCQCLCCQNSQFVVSCIINPAHHNIDFVWRSPQGVPYDSIGAVLDFYEHSGRKVVACMNGGIYNTNVEPQGLYIENHQLIRPLDTSAGKGNFYLQPNGIFSVLDDGILHVETRDQWHYSPSVREAVQSGPMLLVNGDINSIFDPHSTNKTRRNGIGIRRDGSGILAISKSEISFYDFAQYFKEHDCVDALYLDGFISKAFIPSAGLTDRSGHFASMLVVYSR